MFIEKLNEKDFEEFANSYHCSLAEMKKQKDGSVYVQFFTGYMGPSPEFWLTDFDLKSNAYYKHAEKSAENRWRKLLLNKFGEKYKTALSKYLNEKANDIKSEINEL